MSELYILGIPENTALRSITNTINSAYYERALNRIYSNGSIVRSINNYPKTQNSDNYFVITLTVNEKNG